MQNHFRQYLANNGESQELLRKNRATTEICSCSKKEEASKADMIEISVDLKRKMHNTLAQILKRFNIDWNVMRAIMVTTGAVISRSVALAVLQAGEFVPQDLDIYVTSTNLAVLLVFLNEQGYSHRYQPRTQHKTATADLQSC